MSQPGLGSAVSQNPGSGHSAPQCSLSVTGAQRCEWHGVAVRLRHGTVCQGQTEQGAVTHSCHCPRCTGVTLCFYFCLHGPQRRAGGGAGAPAAATGWAWGQGATGHRPQASPSSTGWGWQRGSYPKYPEGPGARRVRGHLRSPDEASGGPTELPKLPPDPQPCGFVLGNVVKGSVHSTLGTTGAARLNFHGPDPRASARRFFVFCPCPHLPAS